MTAWEAFKKHREEQPDKAVRCSFCGRSIHLRRDYGHYYKKYDGKHKCEECYYGK